MPQIAGPEGHFGMSAESTRGYVGVADAGLASGRYGNGGMTCPHVVLPSRRNVVEHVMVISSDGHATARMEDYRSYLDPEFRAEFDEFVVEYEEKGSRNFDPPALRQRLDPDLVRAWQETMVDPGRLEGSSDPHARLKELDREQITAEVLFPDFGLPFELYSPGLAAAKGYPPPDRAHLRAAKRAHNRWVADFCSAAPERFAAMAVVDWTDVEDAVDEIHLAKRAGLKGIVLPFFDPAVPLYHPRHDQIWATLEDLEMVVNSHQALSGTSDIPAYANGVRHPAAAIRLSAGWLVFIVHDLLPQMIWGGVLERFPKLKFVVTESGSSWVVAVLTDMNFAYKGSYLRGDIRDALPISPSEYFEPASHRRQQDDARTRLSPSRRNDQQRHG